MSINNDQDDLEINVRLMPKPKAYQGFYEMDRQVSPLPATSKRMNKLGIDIPAKSQTQNYMLSISEAYNRVLESSDESGIRDSTLDKLCGLAEHTGWDVDVDCDDIARYINEAACKTYRYRQHMWLTSQYGDNDSMYLAETEHDDMLDSLANDAQERNGRSNECYAELLSQEIKNELLSLLYDMGERDRLRLVGATKPNSCGRLEAQTQRAVNIRLAKIPTCTAIAEDMRSNEKTLQLAGK